MNAARLKVIFFDLGDTLVQKVSVSPAGVRFGWVPGAKSLLERMRAERLALGVISNTGSLTRVELLRMMPQDFSFELFDFHLVVLSSETDLQKPDPRIFRLAVNRAQKHSEPDAAFQVDPGDCLFVGEDLGEVLSAQQVGMLGARVNTSTEPDTATLDQILRERGLLG